MEPPVTDMPEDRQPSVRDGHARYGCGVRPPGAQRMGQTGEHTQVSRKGVYETKLIVDKWIAPQPPAQTAFRLRIEMIHRVTPSRPGRNWGGPPPLEVGSSLHRTGDRARRRWCGNRVRFLHIQPQPPARYTSITRLAVIGARKAMSEAASPSRIARGRRRYLLSPAHRRIASSAGSATVPSTVNTANHTGCPSGRHTHLEKNAKPIAK